MSLNDYLRILRRRAWLIVGMIVLFAAAAGLYDSRQPAVYATSTQLIVAVPTDTTGSSRGTAASQAESLGRLVSTPLAVAAATRAASAGPGVVLSVGSQADGTSPFLSIAMTGSEPVALAAVANAYADTLPRVAARLDQLGSASDVELLVISPASVNRSTVSPNPKRDVPIAAFLGLLVGLALTALLRVLDRRVRDSGDIEDTSGLPVLGAIPYELKQVTLPAQSHPASNRAEAYRFLRTNLQFTDAASTPKTLLITSPAPGDGKTSLAANLAVSCALGGERTLLIDADLRRPRVAAVLGMGRSRGLSELLELDDPEVDSYVFAVGDGLSVLPSGTSPRNPSELLAKPRMAALIAAASARYDRVIIDAPPVMAVADALKLAGLVSGVLVVARIDKTSVDELSTTRKRLERTSTPLLGVIANGVVPGRDKAYGYGSYGVYGESSYAEAPVASTGRRRRRRT